ncbi:MAG: peptide deformylase [Candidatus Saccharimonadales bacterium]
MDKNNIITLPNDHLRSRSTKVGLITPEIKRLVRDMEAATLDWEESRKHEVGVALAAIQVDRPLRVVIIRNNFDNKNDKTFTVFVNPTITKYEGKVEQDFEGCLSVPDIYGKVPRHSKVRVKALDLQGREFRVTAQGFLARVFQHEIDHTNGKAFIDHIKDDPAAFFTLNEKGHLEKLDYEKDVRNNHILW